MAKYAAVTINTLNDKIRYCMLTISKCAVIDTASINNQRHNFKNTTIKKQ